MAEIAEQITALKKERGLIKAKFTRFITFINAEANHDKYTQIRARLTKVDDLLEKFEVIQNQIDELSNEASTELNEFDSLYYKEISRAQELLMNERGQGNNSGNNSNNNSGNNSNNNSGNNNSGNNSSNNSGNNSGFNNQIHNNVKLPKIELMTFDGSFDKWLDFYDSFRSMVYTNESLSDIQKFHYLRSCLKDEAANVINSLESTAENFKIAWKLLQDRYDNRRVIIQSHIKTLMELPTITRESADELRKLVDSIKKHMRALTSLGQKVETWDTLLIYIITAKIDRVTHKEWEKSIDSISMPTMETFLKFLEQRCQILRATAFNVSNPNNSTHSSKSNHNLSKRHALTSSHKSNSCIICNGGHQIYACEKFLKMSVPERSAAIKSHRLCFNCLNSGHRNTECKWQGCKKCHRKHNSLLHYERRESQQESVIENNKNVEATNAPSNSSFKALSAVVSTQVLLSTARINVKGKNGTIIQARVLLDSGSQSNFMTKKFADSLQLSYNSIDLPVEGLNKMETRIKQSINTTIYSQQTTYKEDLEFLIIPRICDYLPSQFIDKRKLNIPETLKLADPEFYKPGEIDALLGVEIFYELMCVGQRQLEGHEARMTKTKLGWIIAGKIGDNTKQTQFKKCFVSLDSIHKEIAKFWELEEISEQRFLSEEEYQVEKYYKETTRRDPITNRYIVRLPFNEKILMLGESYQLAYHRLVSVERKLNRNVDMKKQYNEFMREYIQLGHMSEVSNEAKNKGYFMPHHAVIKESSQTTKLRVVFDASAKTKTGISLNNCLKTGPTIQQDIFSVTTRFRTHQHVLTADVEKMYRQILVDERDTPYQQLLYRENDQDEVKIFRAHTVTYGTTSAPYLAIRTLFELADDAKSEYPETAEIIKRDFYVDDILTGADTIKEATILRNNLITITNKGGFPLRKWSSNTLSLVESLPVEIMNKDLLSKGETQKALGVQWNPTEDVIIYKVNSYDDSKVTKRKILSRVAQLYDPIGLLGPIIVSAKLLMQKLWQCEVTWDESVPIDIHTRWININSQLHLLNKIKFNRKVIIENATQVEIHGFSDASERAYGACIYVRSINNNEIMTNLLCAKNRVAPLKSVSLPKLELCGAVLLSRLLKVTLQAICKKIDNVYLWSDSTITLQRIQTQPHLLKTFVANRVAEIRNSTNVTSWKHVSSKDNPADFLSRGQMPVEFIQNSMWKNGPEWLSKEQSHWPKIQFDQVPLSELKTTIALKGTIISTPVAEILKKYSSINKLKRVLAYWVRYLYNLLNHKTSKRTGPLTPSELNQAMKIIIKLTQRESFQAEFNNLSNSKCVANTSDLKALDPFIDDNGLIRVGGRLKHSNLSYSEKHPLVLPKNHYITHLIIKNKHLEHLHSGLQATLHAVRQEFWPVSGKGTVRKVIRQCIKCFRAKPREYMYIMGNLPRDRVTQTRPFLNTGIDYCGPFFIKEKKFRNKNKIKIYAAIFVCFATKACHIELVSDLTTDSFLASLRRFVARRGKCLNIYSDNATNFVGANRELKMLHELVQSEKHNEKMSEILANQNIKWHFSPPRSPHFGGLWEACVKSFKHHFHRIVGDSLFTYEELLTYTTEIEAILNSRPITPLSSDPNDLNALCPSHFLIGDSLMSLPDPDLTDIKVNRLSSWQHIQFIKQHFWKRWSKEYLNELNTRQKWQHQPADNITIGTMVILKEDNSPPLRWPLGRIVSVHAGDDGIVRTVAVKTASGTYNRSAKLVSPLPMQ